METTTTTTLTLTKGKKEANITITKEQYEFLIWLYDNDFLAKKASFNTFESDIVNLTK